MDRYPLADTLEVALAEYALGLIGSEGLPHIGVCALAAGVEGSLLAALAGEKSHGEPRELRELFHRALAEAGIILPEKPRAAATVLDRIVHQVGAKAVSAEVAMPRLQVVFDTLTESADAADAESQSRLDPVSVKAVVAFY